MTTKTRAVVTLKDFLRTTIKDRNMFDSVALAATELGMTPASFKQRLITEKKRYPELYHEWQPYLSDQRRIPTPEEAAALLDAL
jgi:hypothetical protein|tara:strand:- start:406 stop:657 length:252 start_codon:yes stop_codon:yes gene_type:complete